jgi:hypothetical protein
MENERDGFAIHVAAIEYFSYVSVRGLVNSRSTKQKLAASFLANDFLIGDKKSC